MTQKKNAIVETIQWKKNRIYLTLIINSGILLIMNELLNINKLVGMKVGLHGVNHTTVQISNKSGDKLTFEVVEDENDGYRSMLKEVVIVQNNSIIAPAQPVALVTITESNGLYYFTDEYDHVWLKFGTDDADDYYPIFVFSYTLPKPAIDRFIAGNQ